MSGENIPMAPHRAMSRTHIFMGGKFPERVFLDRSELGTDVVVFNSVEPIPAKLGSIDVVIPAGIFTWPKYLCDEPLCIDIVFDNDDNINTTATTPTATTYELRALKPEYKSLLRQIDLYVCFKNCSVIITRGAVFYAGKISEKKEECNSRNDILDGFESDEKIMEESRAKSMAEYGTTCLWDIVTIRANHEFYDRIKSLDYWEIAVPVFSR